jgi:hypothetical protein
MSSILLIIAEKMQNIQYPMAKSEVFGTSTEDQCFRSVALTSKFEIGHWTLDIRFRLFSRECRSRLLDNVVGNDELTAGLGGRVSPQWPRGGAALRLASGLVESRTAAGIKDVQG